MNTNTMHGLSRWKRPTVFASIVALYLLLIPVVALSWYGHELAVERMEFSITNLLLLSLLAGVLPVTGSIFLLRKIREGIIISMVALLPWTIFLLASFIIFDPSGPQPSPIEFEMSLDDPIQILLLPILASAAAMYLLLVMAWKSIQWR